MKSYRKYLFWVFWVIMAGVTALLWFKYDTNSDFIGLVESRVHVLSVQESGRVARVTAAQGDSVAAGQVLVELDMSDLDAGRAVLEAELARLERHLDADRARAGLEYEKLRTQSAADSLNMDLKKADLAEKMAELQAVQGEIDRLQAAEREGLGRSADLSDLIIRRDTLTRVISAQRAAIGRRTDTGAVKGGQERDSVVQSMMGDSLARIGEIKVELACFNHCMSGLLATESSGTWSFSFQHDPQQCPSRMMDVELTPDSECGEPTVNTSYGPCLSCTEGQCGCEEDTETCARTYTAVRE